ncbi:MAG: hypothetical protein KF729_13310 [Sandaracinaceae bacterium]|nr:hypothetical protein [Sandaracinaceae bacterium]
MRASLTLAALAALALATLPSSDALAQHRVVVAPFSGGGAANVTRQVSRAIAESVDVVPSREASRAARSAGVSGLGAGGVPALAEQTGAQIAILGEVETSGGGGGGGRRRRRRRAPSTAQRTVRMVAYAADGRELSRGEVTYAPSGVEALETAAITLVSRAVSALSAAAAPAREPAPPPRFEPEPEPAPPPSDAPEDGLALLSAWLGLVVRSRDAYVELPGPPLGERRYGATLAELGVALELRPFAREGHLGRGTFATFDFFHSVGLGSVDDTGAAVTTNFARFLLTAGWLAPLGDAVELGVGLGGGYEGYHFGPNPILPTAEIAYVRAAARGRVRLVQETFVLELDLAYRGVLGIGDFAGAFGQNAETHGVDVGVGVTGNLARVADLGFTWALRFHYVGYFTSYSGVASDAAGSSGSEESFRLTLLAGWSF